MCQRIRSTKSIASNRTKLIWKGVSFIGNFLIMIFIIIIERKMATCCRSRVPSVAELGAACAGSYGALARCTVLTALANDALRTPLLACVEPDHAPAALWPLLEVIDERVVRPLKQARDDLEWADALDEVLDHWIRLRLSFVTAMLELEGEAILDRFEEAVGVMDEIPLTLLPEPAHGAARHAIAVLAGTCEATLAAVRRKKHVDWALVEALIGDIAVVELAWLTLAGPVRPRASVAEAAAWEGYSRARPLRAWLLRAGLDASALPKEEPTEARARAAALLGRVSSGWSDEEQAALSGARLPAGALQ